MRCVGCETEPPTSAHYCECCGGRLSLHETQAVETAPATGPDHRAPDGKPASDARCESCGGPSAIGDLCPSCQRAFFSSWLDSAAPAAPLSDPAPALAYAAPIEEIAWSELVTSVASAHDASDTATPVEVAVSAPVLREATITSVDDKAAAANAEAVRADEARAKTVGTEEVKTQAALPKGLRTEATSAASTPKPAVVIRRPNVPVPSPHRRHSIALAAAAVVVAAIGVGAYWLQTQEQPVIAREGEETLVAKNVTVAKRRPSASGRSAAATTATRDRKSVAAPPQVPASARPKPAASPPGVVPATEAPAPAVAPPAPDVVAATPPPVLPAPPVGRFFETMDVNESPRVATRVEPQLPDELRARPLNEIVIVRVLVSQGGHPSRISLLRRSKTGPRLDDAVIAAVNQWTFAPARKRGEAVSCWFNFGVPVGRAD